ncbi:hypothetical protein GVV04_23090 [Micromonospora sp. NEAU-HG-1]|nr:hypothetical protein [Micromonospora rubida]
MVDYLTGVLLARDLPAAAVEAAGRAFADEAGPPAATEAASWAATFRYADAAARLVEQAAAAPDGRRVTLVVGARTFADLYDAISLDRLQRAHGWLTIVPAFSHDVFAEPAERGDALTVALDHHEPGQEVYVCGPPAMLAGARLRLRAAGVPAGRSRLPETFTR